jgi:hypothetical protein
MQQCMKIFRRAAGSVALGLLASAPVVPLTRVLADFAQVQPSALATPAAPLRQTTPVRLLAALRSKIPVEPVEVDGDPYVIWQSKEPPLPPAGTVCGVRFEQDQVHYHLATFGTTAAARAAGFAITHFGACGTCSTLQDLAVYLERPDLTAPVRWCGIRTDASASLTCLENLGFSTPCAQTWLYNLQNTRRRCLGVCAWSWIRGEAPTRADGSLNACLQCDEDRSGPVFKATAGRTRRNSGIQSSIPRPTDDVAPVVHDYVPDLAPN